MPGLILQHPRSPVTFEDRCKCGELYSLHWDVTGTQLIGCDGAQRRRALGLVRDSPDPSAGVWGDQHPEASQAVQSVLAVASHPALIQVWQELSFDDRLCLSRRIAQYCIGAYLRSLASPKTGGRL